MTLFHFRYRDRLGLLAEGALPSAEERGLRSHAESCAECRDELRRLDSVVVALRSDAAVERPLPISSGALFTRVRARIQSEAAPARAREEPRVASFVAAIGLVAAGALIALVTSRFSPAPGGETASNPVPPATVADAGPDNAAFYERLEQSHARASAARYLAEAQDVLVQMTAASAAAADCPDAPKDSVDVTRESETSKELLKRRATLVAGSSEAFASARGVMDEVEGVLQQVAELPQCTRRHDVDAIARSVDRRKLLMKIDLVAQELGAL